MTAINTYKIKKNDFKALLVIFFIWYSMDLFIRYLNLSDAYAPILRMLLIIYILISYSRITLKKHYLFHFTIFMFGFLFYLININLAHPYFSLRLALFSILLFSIIIILIKNEYLVIKIVNIITIVIFLSLIYGYFYSLPVYGGEENLYNFGGSRGAIYSANEFSYLVVSILGCNLILLSKEVKKNRFIKRLLLVLLSCISAVLLSTKAAIFGGLIYIFLYLIIHKRNYLLFILVLAIPVYFLFLNEILESINQYQSFVRLFYEIDKSDLINGITSNRYDRFINYDFTSYWWILPGFGEYINFESDILDIVFISGLWGLIFLYYVFINIRSVVGKLTMLGFLYVILIFFISILSGHLLSSVYVAPAFGLLILLSSTKFSKEIYD
jgi:hypothetical protein